MPNVTSTKFWHRVDGALTRTAARRAGDIRNGIAASIDPVKVAELFLNDFHEGTVVTPEFARSWARLHIKPDNTQLSKALNRAWAEGYALGQTAGFAAIGRAKLRKDAATDKAIADALAVDWSTWTPGNVAAALIAHPRGGFARILDKRVSTLTNLDATSLDRIGTQLSDALLEGLAPADLARRIIADVENVITSSSRALTIATTEMNSAMSIASMDTYKENGVEQVEWIGLEACDYCQDNIDASPIPVGEEFPTGDTEPPGHANCRCSIAPFIDWAAIEGENVDAIEMALKPELKREPSTGVPGPYEAARAISRLAILPNPADPALEEPEKYVESPWQVVDVPTVNPNLWDTAEKVLVDLNELYGTDPYLKRKRIVKHIEAMGQALTEYRSYPLVVERKGDTIILDGHHRLMSVWLLGQETAAVWKVKI